MVSEPVSTPEQENVLDRRSMLQRCCALGAVGVVGLAAAACSSSGTDQQSVGQQGGGQQGGGNQQQGGASGSNQGGGQAGGAQGQVLARTSQIPVGGGMVIAAQKVVVTQPTAGDFRAFSAVCTHQGCLVNGVSGGIITCPCHGSQFSATDGTVQRGPANMPLDKLNIQVQGDSIMLG